MSEQAPSGTTAEPERHLPGDDQPSSATTPAAVEEPIVPNVPGTIGERQPQLRNHRVVRSEDLPRFSIGAPIAVGMIIWLLLLTAGIIWRDDLAADGRTWWIWCAVTGVVLGLLGWLYTATRLKDQPGQGFDEDGRPIGDGPAGPFQN